MIGENVCRFGKGDFAHDFKFCGIDDGEFRRLADADKVESVFVVNDNALRITSRDALDQVEVFSSITSSEPFSVWDARSRLRDGSVLMKSNFPWVPVNSTG